MKVCSRCGVEICTRDGENKCPECENAVRTSPKKRKTKKALESAMSDLGLVKVRGALGGIYWE